MKANLIWQSYDPDVPSRGYWDTTMLEDLFSHKLWNPVNGYEFQEYKSLVEIPEGEGAVVVFPARRQIAFAERLNQDLARLPWVILLIVGDEESSFPIKSIKHPKLKLWLMTPLPGGVEADRYLIHGYTPDTRKLLQNRERNLDWFFSGQVTHDRRRRCVEVLRTLENGYLKETAGFTQGLEHQEYYDLMSSAKVIPCPSGPCTPDSFRVAEALEAGCIPMADNHTPDIKFPIGYWTHVFKKDPPFYVVKDWQSFPGYLKEALEGWPKNANKVSAWWQNHKRQLSYNMRDDIAEIGPKPGLVNGVNTSSEVKKNKITVVMPTSPIPSNPDTSIIEETIKSVRHHLPNCEVLVMIDGIRPELQERSVDYERYKQQLLWKCNHEWSNVLPVVFEEHCHQAKMTRRALDIVETPLILFVEHDTPLVTDESIPWHGLSEAILSGEAYMIRFHYEAMILDCHKYLMLDAQPSMYGHGDAVSVPLTRTIQWSQRPHLASAAFYRRILKDHFSEHAVTMIEDRMHGVVQESYKDEGLQGWHDYRLMIYTPPGNTKRSLHLDGRGHDSKFESGFKF